MANRIAGVTAIIVFAVCLVVGGIQAGNTFTTTVERALTAMAVTLVIGLVLGAMATKMVEENVKSHEEKLNKNYTTPTQGDR